MPANTGATERLQALPDQTALTPGLRTLALQLASLHPALRIDSIGLRDDGGGVVLMVDLSITLERLITDPDLLAEIGAWQEEQQSVLLG